MRGPVVLAAILAVGMHQASAQPACLTDVHVDDFVGARVRAGAPYVDTRDVPDRPLCSGLTLAQQIQRIRAAAFPEEHRRQAVADAGPIPDEDEADEESRPALDPVPLVRLPTVMRARRKIAAPVVTARRRAPPAPVTARSSGAVFGSCRAARAAGAAPIRRGQAGYSGRLDRDGDGVACE